MSTISGFLRSLAALVRRLTAEGRAVHVTEQTAQELELLAGLFEQHGSVRYHQNGIVHGNVVLDVAIEATVAPADIALGWLLASKWDPERCAMMEERAIDRAAVCAEVAVIVGQIRLVEPALPGDHSFAAFAQNCAAHARIEPHDGTRDGARAAWQFVVEQLTLSASQGIPLDRRGGKTENWAYCAADVLALAETFRRELETMK